MDGLLWLGAGLGDLCKHGFWKVFYGSVNIFCTLIWVFCLAQMSGGSARTDLSTSGDVAVFSCDGKKDSEPRSVCGSSASSF